MPGSVLEEQMKAKPAITLTPGNRSAKSFSRPRPFWISTTTVSFFSSGGRRVFNIDWLVVFRPTMTTSDLGIRAVVL